MELTEKRIPIRVTTYVPETDEIENERVIDHNNHSDRVWLGNHSFWAMRNGFGVDVEPLPDS